MMPPTSIDGTDITGATIDGQDVQEITVDGQTVFTAGTTPADAFARYRFENDVTDSNGSNDGTDETSAGFSGNAQEGSFAKEFDGSNDYVDIGQFPLSSFSLAIWIRPDSVSSRQTMIHRFDPDESPKGWYLSVESDGKLRFSLTNNVSGSTVLSTGTYTHVAAVNDENGDAKVFIDGEEDGTNVGGGEDVGDPTTRDIEIGRRGKRGGFADYFDGLIDDVLIFDTALSDSDVQAIYDSY